MPPSGLTTPACEFEITPNRPDCLSVIGLAREAAATFEHAPRGCLSPLGGAQRNRRYPRPAASGRLKTADLCPRYTAAHGPQHQDRPLPPLDAGAAAAPAGVRPINNIVDITNYVMLEYGQPMHAFDYRMHRAAMPSSYAAPGPARPLTTLDGQERQLDPEHAGDRRRPKSRWVWRGVMGGLNSEITERHPDDRV